MRLIQYDNFSTSVDEQKGPQGQTLRVLSITDEEGATIHQFAYSEETAKGVGAAMMGTGIMVAPAGALGNLASIADRLHGRG